MPMLLALLKAYSLCLLFSYFLKSLFYTICDDNVLPILWQTGPSLPVFVALPRRSASNKQKEGVKSSKKSDVKSSQKSDNSANTTSQVHCVCSSTKDVGHMVECESCCQWSHCNCVSLSPSLASSYPFVCPFCIKSLFSRLSNMESEVVALSN